MYGNTSHLLSKTQQLYLKEMGIKKSSNKKGIARNQLLKKAKIIHDEWMVQKWDFEVQENLSPEEVKAVRFAEGIPNDYESNIKFQSIQIDDLFDKVLILYKLNYNVDVKSKVRDIERGIVTHDKSVKDFFNFRAVNFINFQNYSPKFFSSIEEKILFEYLLMLDEYFKDKYNLNKFYHSKDQFKNRIGIKATKLNNALAKFERLGFITRSKEGMPLKTYFKLHIPKIVSSLPQILISYKKTEN
jgi:hypothetical protein